MKISMDPNTSFDIADVQVKRRHELPLVWLLPIVALIVSGWLITKSIVEKGPEITITFPDASGIEVDKTKIKFRDVDVGKVTAITITNDLKAVQVTAQMEPYTVDYLNANTRFWVVRPRIGLTEVSGVKHIVIRSLYRC